MSESKWMAPDRRLEEGVRVVAECMYGPPSKVVVRAGCYDEIAIHQEGGKRSVYLTRWGAARLGLGLIRESLTSHKRRRAAREADFQANLDAWRKAEAG